MSLPRKGSARRRRPSFKPGPPEAPKSRIKDHTQAGSMTLVREGLRKLENELLAVTQTMSRSPRTSRKVTLGNIAKRAALDVRRMREWATKRVDLLAWCTRNLFELDLIARYVLSSDEHLVDWAAALAAERVQTFEGLLALCTEMTPEDRKSILDQIAPEIERHRDGSKTLLGKEPHRMPQVPELAAEVGQTKEYRALFRFCSVFVHPSSWAVNSDEEAELNSPYYRNIFLVMGQVYAQDILNRISETGMKG